MKEYTSIMMFIFSFFILLDDRTYAQNSIIKYLESEKVSAFDFGCFKAEHHLGEKLSDLKSKYALNYLLVGVLYDPNKDRFVIEVCPVSHSSFKTACKTICHDVVKEVKMSLAINPETSKPFINGEPSSFFALFKGQGTPVKQPNNAGKELDRLTDVKCSYLFQDKSGGPHLTCESHLLDPKILCSE